MPKTLLRIADEQYGKGCTDKHWRHNYLPWYDEHFARFQSESIKVLEIGVQRGASLRLWQEYFSNAKIYGIDKDHNCARFADDRTQIFIGIQSDAVFLSKVAEAGPFDIVIDDGSHQMHDQQVSFEVLWPHVSAGGYYVIEDLYTSYLANFNKNGCRSTVEVLKGLVDKVNKESEIESLHFYKELCFVRKTI